MWCTLRGRWWDQRFDFPHNASLTSHGRVLDIDFCLFFLYLEPISVKEVMKWKPPLCFPAHPSRFDSGRARSRLRDGQGI